MTNLVNMIEELGEKFDAATGDLSMRLGDLERRAARQHDNDNGRYNAIDFANQVVNHSDVKRLTSDFRGKAVIKLSGEMAAITSAPATVGNNTSASTSLVTAQRQAAIVTPPERRYFIRDLIATSPTVSSSVEYTKETGYTNNADVVSEGAQKPYSDLTFDLDVAPVRTLAHLFKTSRQIMDDAPRLESYIRRRATYGLKTVEDSQVFFGDGTGQNLEGIVPQASAYETARTAAGDTELDILLHAISQAEEAEYAASGIVMSVADWRRILGIKDGDERYLSNGPFGTTAPRIWDLPVYPTNSFATGQFLVGAFQDGAEIFDRLEAEVLLSTENDDDFEKNMMTLRCEERLALAVYRPEAFVTGSFSEPVSG